MAILARVCPECHIENGVASGNRASPSDWQTWRVMRAAFSMLLFTGVVPEPDCS